MVEIVGGHRNKHAFLFPVGAAFYQLVPALPVPPKPRALCGRLRVKRLRCVALWWGGQGGNGAGAGAGRGKKLLRRLTI